MHNHSAENRADVVTALAMIAVTSLILVVGYVLSREPYAGGQRLVTVSSNIVGSN